MVTLNTYLALSGILFALGFIGVLTRRNALVNLMCLELMLGAVSLMLIAFSRYNNTFDGAVFMFFIITVAAAEVALGLALLVALYRKTETVQLDAFDHLKD